MFAPVIKQSCSCQCQVVIKYLPVSFNMHCAAFETESLFSLVRLFVSSLAPSPRTIPGAGNVLLEVLYLAFLPQPCSIYSVMFTLTLSKALLVRNENILTFEKQANYCSDFPKIIVVARNFKLIGIISKASSKKQKLSEFS